MEDKKLFIYVVLLVFFLLVTIIQSEKRSTSDFAYVIMLILMIYVTVEPVHKRFERRKGMVWKELYYRPSTS